MNNALPKLSPVYSSDWFALPKALCDRIWATYEPGQEVDMTPSDAYLDAADAVQRWIQEE